MGLQYFQDYNIYLVVSPSKLVHRYIRFKTLCPYQYAVWNPLTLLPLKQATDTNDNVSVGVHCVHSTGSSEYKCVSVT